MSLDRHHSEMDAERVDDLGFLDPLRSPKIRRYSDLLSNPIAWVLGPPWLGKSTAAAAIWNRLRVDQGFEGRVTLSKLGLVGAERETPPSWWAAWVNDPTPFPAVWLIDGVDEAPGENPHLL